MCPREKGFVLWGHCQNLLDDPRKLVKIKEKVILFFSNYLPLQIWTLKICIHDISKTITARSFKLCQLIEDDEEINR